MSHNSLENYFRTLAVLKSHNYDISEIEELPVWERDFYVDLLMEKLRQEDNSEGS